MKPFCTGSSVESRYAWGFSMSSNWVLLPRIFYCFCFLQSWERLRSGYILHLYLNVLDHGQYFSLSDNKQMNFLMNFHPVCHVYTNLDSCHNLFSNFNLNGNHASVNVWYFLFEKKCSNSIVLHITFNVEIDLSVQSVFLNWEQSTKNWLL